MFGLTKDLEPESHRFFQRYSFPLISSSAVTSNKLHQTIQSVIRQRSRRRGRMLETSLWGRWGLERELNIPRFTHPQTNYYPTSSFSSYSDFLISSNTVGEYNCLHSFPGGCKSHTNAFCLTSPLGQTSRCSITMKNYARHTIQNVALRQALIPKAKRLFEIMKPHL